MKSCKKHSKGCLTIFQIYGQRGPEWVISPEIGSADSSILIANTSAINKGKF